MLGRWHMLFLGVFWCFVEEGLLCDKRATCVRRSIEK